MSRNPHEQIHYFSVRLEQEIFHLWGGFSEDWSHNTVQFYLFLLATPSFQLLLRAGPKMIPTSPYEILLKNVSPCVLCTKAKLLLECSVELWESR